MRLLYGLVALVAGATSAVAAKQELKPTHHVTLDIEKDGGYLGQIHLELYGTVVPRTVNNFVELCKGYERDGLQYSYKGVPFHRIIPNFMIQGGDITRKNGTGSISIYGDSFEDESFKLLHNEPGVISMANSGPDTNGSQFFITTVKTHWLDGRHVVFGRVFRGMEVVQMIESNGSSSGAPRASIIISDCNATTL